MKTFIVKVEIQAGEYQKQATALVKGKSQTEAEAIALEGECHGTLGDNAEWTQSGIADLGWQFHYSVHSSTEVEPEHVSILNKYL
ncbi:hypothetical protein [Marinomonas algarum]|uniref:Uncharacterized protein n=1 Tax=Marinomonas algarum TaxID=2883105 RepID=A0A9X1LFE7_9GAMM|nr:hypothetical protein [Marinomonas algarum]MCB5162947.1 hypothetical protein [Marinomonas algarum]